MQALTSCSKCELDRTVTDPESGEVVCGLCGMVIEDKLEVAKEKTYTQRLHQGTGSYPSIASYDMGLSTVIGGIDKDAKGQKIQTSVNSVMQRLRTWDYRIQMQH